MNILDQKVKREVCVTSNSDWLTDGLIVVHVLASMTDFDGHVVKKLFLFNRHIKKF